MNAIATQVGGSHYLSLAIQPRVFAMRNAWDSDSFSILKYVTRFEGKLPLEDLKKARHFAEMRKAWKDGPVPETTKPRLIISMQRYIYENGLKRPHQVMALQALDNWVRRPGLYVDTYAVMLHHIDALISEVESHS